MHIAHWKKIDMKANKKPEQNFVAAFKTIFGISEYLKKEQE
jgi:hypothetical protein